MCCGRLPAQSAPPTLSRRLCPHRGTDHSPHVANARWVGIDTVPAVPTLTTDEPGGTLVAEGLAAFFGVFGRSGEEVETSLVVGVRIEF